MRIISKLILMSAFLPIIVNAADISKANWPFSTENLNLIENSIIEARSKLSTIASKMPEKRLDVVMFFERDMQLAEAIESIKSQGIDITGFRHGTPEHSGGYMIGENETMEEALTNYRRDHVLFLERDAELTRSMLSVTQNDEQVKEALSARLSQIRLRQSDYVNRGLRIIGLEMSGPSGELVQVWDSNPKKIRALEVLDGRPVPNKFRDK